MATFKARTTAPAVTNKFYVNYKNGGYNTSVIVDTKTGFCLPNCVAYCQGRLRECINDTSVWSKIGVNFACNAEDWYANVTKAGLTCGSTPKLGSVICWKSGKTGNSSDGCGHVAFVEGIAADGTITVSESAYGGYLWKTEQISKPYARTGKTFLGFIYPSVDYGTDQLGKTTAATATTTTTEDYTKNTIANRFKVKVLVNGSYVQKGAYTGYAGACSAADKISGVVFDGTTGKIIYTAKSSATKTLTATSYSDYVANSGKYYYVMTEPQKWVSGKGAFTVWKNAYKTYAANKAAGYHVYDCNWKQLD